MADQLPPGFVYDPRYPAAVPAGEAGLQVGQWFTNEYQAVACRVTTERDLFGTHPGHGYGLRYREDGAPEKGPDDLDGWCSYRVRVRPLLPIPSGADAAPDGQRWKLHRDDGSDTGPIFAFMPACPGWVWVSEPASPGTRGAAEPPPAGSGGSEAAPAGFAWDPRYPEPLRLDRANLRHGDWVMGATEGIPYRIVGKLCVGAVDVIQGDICEPGILYGHQPIRRLLRAPDPTGWRLISCPGAEHYDDARHRGAVSGWVWERVEERNGTGEQGEGGEVETVAWLTSAAGAPIFAHIDREFDSEVDATKEGRTIEPLVKRDDWQRERERAENLRRLADEAASEAGLAQRRMGEAQAARGEALARAERAEVTLDEVCQRYNDEGLRLGKLLREAQAERDEARRRAADLEGWKAVALEEIEKLEARARARMVEMEIVTAEAEARRRDPLLCEAWRSPEASMMDCRGTCAPCRLRAERDALRARVAELEAQGKGGEQTGADHP